uniref:Putative regulation of transcription n=1 Tax=Corethrella appendiculata TaxID=1370023 RepID=U5EU27_9DIPT
MEQWLKDQLSICLMFEVPEEMIKYILSMQNHTELDEYFKTLLDFDKPEHVTFLQEFKQKLSKKNNKKQKSQQNGKQQIQTVQAAVSPTSTESTSTGAKKKTKYVNMYGQNGEMNNVILLKGRLLCDCQATKHKLINNCIKCGRIVCEQEGSGPCMFCGNLVCTDEEQKVIDSSSRKGDNLKRSLMEQNRPKGWEEAIATRNRLLEYDRNSEKRTTVIDDELDYFKTNSVWLSDKEREKLEKMQNVLMERKHGSRLNRKVALDFTGKQVVEEPQVDYEDEILKNIAESVGNSDFYIRHQDYPLPDSIHPGIVGDPPIFDEMIKSQNENHAKNLDCKYNRVQDKEFLEMSDMRHCLSMHQPWASLLIAGIKRHEGRTWYSSHRGRLWIAATAKPVDMDLVKQMENFYRIHYNDENIIFPSQYPSACLLGCVSVQDCLPQEEYRKIYPNGESESPFVFVCSNPQELPIRFPVKGQHKIYELDTKIHTAACKALLRISKIKSEG